MLRESPSAIVQQWKSKAFPCTWARRAPDFSESDSLRIAKWSRWKKILSAFCKELSNMRAAFELMVPDVSILETSPFTRVPMSARFNGLRWSFSKKVNNMVSQLFIFFDLQVFSSTYNLIDTKNLLMLRVDNPKVTTSWTLQAIHRMTFRTSGNQKKFWSSAGAHQAAP